MIRYQFESASEKTRFQTEYVQIMLPEWGLKRDKPYVECGDYAPLCLEMEKLPVQKQSFTLPMRF
jgi:hypothetical protein